MADAIKLVGVVLAAGAGSRLGTPKAELVLGGTRLVDRAVAAFAGAGCRELIAVTRSGIEVSGARVVLNPDPSTGMRSSLELAVHAAADWGADAAAVIVVDTPGVGSPAIRSVLEGWRPGQIAVGTYDGRRGHPTVMSIDLWRRAIDLAGPDEGARALLKAEPWLVVEIAVAGDPSDLDTVADLIRWRSLVEGSADTDPDSEAGGAESLSGAESLGGAAARKGGG